MIERADQQLDNVSRDFSLFGDLNGKINEQLDVISESGEALLGTKFDVYKPMVETFQNLFSNIEEQGTGIFEAMKGPLQPIYNQLSKQKGLLSLLGISSIGALGGESFYEREKFGIADQFEMSYLENLKDNDPDLWAQQSESLKTLFDIYTNIETTSDGENLADILEQSDIADHPLKLVKFESVVSSVMDFHGMGKNISPEFLYGTARGKKYVEKNGDELLLKQLSRQDVRDICKSCIVQLWTPESLSLLRLTKASDQVEGMDYANTYVAGVFSMLVGMNPNHVFYDTDSIQTKLSAETKTPENQQRNPVQPLTTTPLSDRKVFRSYEALFDEYPVSEETLSHFESLPDPSDVVFKNPGSSQAQKLGHLIRIGNLMDLGFSGRVFPLMALLESGRKFSSLAADYHNYTGIKDTSGNGVSMGTKEKRNGNYQGETHGFRVFSDDQAFANYYKNLLGNSRYSPAINQLSKEQQKNPLQVIYQIVGAGYATAGPQDYVFGIDLNGDGRLQYGVRGVLKQIDAMIDRDATLSGGQMA